MTERELFDPALNELGDSRSHNGDSEVSELVAGLVLVYDDDNHPMKQGLQLNAQGHITNIVK